MLVQIIVWTLPVEKLFLQANVPPVLKVTSLMQGIFVWHWYFFISSIFSFIKPPVALSLQFLSPVFYPRFAQRKILNSTTSVSFMLSATMSFSMFWAVHFTLFQSPLNSHPQCCQCSDTFLLLQDASSLQWFENPLTRFFISVSMKHF